ncbi:helix-turn-helix domain-containing protein [Paenibacillus sp. FSL K6-1230]|uniref:helix-turn-helix domain-containing protein n=1 Tax=Paenibacillus sp. FSL K6-1230 TaxID=2921603 RepID=UPI0030F7783F
MYEIFEKLLKERNVTAYRVAKETGITTATLTSWKQGKYTPKQEKLQKIADYFGVSLDFLLGTAESDKSTEELQYPEWATPKDVRDFKTILEEDQPVMFDGIPISEDDKEKIKRVMEAMFWDAKKKNKETYGRKKSED